MRHTAGITFEWFQVTVVVENTVVAEVKLFCLRGLHPNNLPGLKPL